MGVDLGKLPEVSREGVGTDLHFHSCGCCQALGGAPIQGCQPAGEAPQRCVWQYLLCVPIRPPAPPLGPRPLRELMLSHKNANMSMVSFLSQAQPPTSPPPPSHSCQRRSKGLGGDPRLFFASRFLTGCKTQKGVQSPSETSLKTLYSP